MLKLGNPAQSLLPFMVIGAMTWTASRLLLAAHVKAQVAYAVVRFYAIHMVNAFRACQSTPKMFGHYPSVFEHKSSLTPHCIEHRQVAVGNRVLREVNIPTSANGAAGGVSVGAKCSRPRHGVPTRTACANEVWVPHLLAKCSDSYDPAFFAERASDPMAWSGMPSNCGRNGFCRVDGMVHRERCGVATSCHVRDGVY